MKFQFWILISAFSIGCSGGSSSNSVTGLDGEAPQVNAGADQVIASGATAVLNATVTDDGLPSPSQLTYLWSKESGPGVVTFDDATAKDTTARFSSDGTYVLKLTASDGLFSASDTVTIIVGTASNTAPQVGAGPDQAIALPMTAVLSGVATDDGLPNPPGAITYLWTKNSGPGTVAFTDSSAAATTASFSAAGVYVLRLSASDGELTNSDLLTITVHASAGAQRFAAARAVWTANCTSCHSWQTFPEAEFVNGGLIVAGNYQNSKMYYRLNGSDGPNGPKTMPQGGAQVTEAELAAIKDWINNFGQ